MKREFPERPLVGVGGVVFSNRRVLLARRARDPLKGQWSIPGGLLHVGEKLEAGVRRELREETGLEVEPVSVLGVFDRILTEKSRVKYHYVLIDYLCRRLEGEAVPGSDVSQVRWVRVEELGEFQLWEDTRAVVEKAFRLADSFGL
jgi:mutator protein MutT